MNSQDISCVSVVIPTFHRPELLIRAVKSVLNQTVLPLEIIVVIDGPDLETQKALEIFDSSLLKVLILPKRSGGSTARNKGAFHAKGDWIAFLDDDDEWLPNKLESQLDIVLRSTYIHPIVATQVIARTPSGDFCWPRKSPPSQMSLIGDYLLSRNGFFKGEGLLQTSTLLIQKKLLLKLPFDEGLAAFQDWDWMIRAAQVEGTGIEFVPKPLAIWYTEEQRVCTSTGKTWHYDLKWIKEKRSIISARAYSGFIVTNVNPKAAESRDYKAFGLMLKEVVSNGQIQFIDILLLFGMWLIPRKIRHIARRLIT